MSIRSPMLTNPHIGCSMFTSLRHLTELPTRRHTPPAVAAMTQLVGQRLQQRLRTTEIILGSSSSSRRREWSARDTGSSPANTVLNPQLHAAA